MASSAVSHSSSGQLLPAAVAGSMMARVDRLDLAVGYLEEMRGHGGGGGSARSSTSPSTPTTFSSSSPTTPRSRCRPAEELLREAKAKGSLVERIAFLESRVLRMEEDRMSASSLSMEMTPPERTGRLSSSMLSGAGGGSGAGSGSGRRKKGLKSLVKSCVRGGAKLKTKD